jgi:hypothetical protein
MQFPIVDYHVNWTVQNAVEASKDIVQSINKNVNYTLKPSRIIF